MIYFVVPLKSMRAAQNWDRVSENFNRTLASLYGQNDSDFRIIVACHEIPQLTNRYDDRVEFLTTDSIVPTNPKEMMLDKGWKISMAAVRIRELGGGSVMMVDADDLVSNRIAGYVKDHPHANGFLSSFGYIYNQGFPYVKRALALYRTCGSCAIVKYRAADLPDTMPNNPWDTAHRDSWIIRKPHRYLPSYLKDIDRALETIPFPTTVYVRNTGENHSMIGGSDLSWKRKIELSLRRKILINSQLKEEFGF